MRARHVLLIGAITTLASAPLPSSATVPTTLEANAVVAVTVLSPGNTFDLDTGTEMGATLSDEAGDPVVGRLIDFTAGGEPLCSASTNAAGYASCGSDRTGGYFASFAGDEVFAPSTDEGSVIRIWSGALGLRVIVLGDETLVDVRTS